MARAPDARAEQAKELFLSGKKLIEISEILKVPEGTIRSWKNRYKWNTATLQKSKCNVAKKRGGQLGNKNAEGNKGGAAPQQNKNAVKTGEFETLFFDALEPEELQLIRLIQPDKERLLLQEIQLLTVRERRMMKRIDELSALKEIQAIEEALTRVQARRQRAIETLHKFGYDNAHLELIKAQVDKLYREGQNDDGEEGVEIVNDAPKEEY